MPEPDRAEASPTPEASAVSIASLEELTPARLVAVLCADQRKRWLRGERIGAEAYREQHALLRADDDAFLDLVYSEIVLREEQGDGPRLEDYVGRFPEFAEPLRRLFEVHRAIESIPVLDERKTEPYGPAAEPESESTTGREPETRPPPAADRLPRIPGYEFLALLGRGGMGLVFKARQVSLKRLVAVKMILADQLASAGEVQRFRAEAEAAAHLQHPHIVAIHEVGEHDGRHFFSMDYIEGKSLAALVRGKPLPAARAVRYVQIIAETIQFAHERGILHRDLKPSNVLIDANDQPRVTDFGLAKRLTGEPGGLTLTGTVLGTPSYMPPEQAAGHGRQVGPTSDVYSLGAMLYELLTGRPPFRGESSLDTLLQVQQTDPVNPRLLNPSIDRDLETICLKCLEKEPARRYLTAQALADDLGRFLSHEPILARPLSRTARLGRWCRRKPALAGMAAALLLVLLGGFTGIFWQWRRAEANLDEANSLRTVAEHQRTRAEEQSVQAAENFRQARKTVDDFFIRVSEDALLNIPGLQPVRRKLLQAALAYYERFAKEHEDDPTLASDLAAAYYRVGVIADDIGSKREALAAFQQARTIQEGLPPSPVQQVELARCDVAIGRMEQALGRLPEAAQSLRQAIQRLEQAVRDAPAQRSFQSELAKAYSDCGAVQLRQAQRQEAVKSFEQAQELRSQLVQADAANIYYLRDLAATSDNIATAQNELGQPAKAIAAYEQACAIGEKLVQAHPDVLEFQYQLGRAYYNRSIPERRTNQLEAALQSHERARAILEPLAEDNPKVTDYQRLLALNCGGMAILYSQTGRSAETLQAYRVAMAAQQKLARRNPAVPQFQRDLFATYVNMGFHLCEAQQFPEALAAYQEAQTIIEKLLTAYPLAQPFQNDLATVFNNIGIAHREAGRPADALEPLLKARALRERLLQASPSLLEVRSDLGATWNDLGRTFRRLDRTDDALAAFQQAVAQQKTVFAKAPQVALYRRRLTDHYTQLAELLRTLKRTTEADAALTELKQLLGEPAQQGR